MHSTRRVKFIYPVGLQDQPILYTLVKDYNLVTNVRGASGDGGWLVLDLEGDSEAILAGMAWAKGKGVDVKEHVRRRVKLFYPGDSKEQPIVYRLARDFNLVTNIRGANAEEAWLLVDLEGDEDSMKAGIAWTKSRGVEIKDE